MSQNKEDKEERPLNEVIAKVAEQQPQTNLEAARAAIEEIKSGRGEVPDARLRS